MFGTGSNAELTRKYERVKVQNDIRTSKHIKQTNIPDFQIVLPLRVSRSLHSLAKISQRKKLNNVTCFFVAFFFSNSNSCGEWLLWH